MTADNPVLAMVKKLSKEDKTHIEISKALYRAGFCSYKTKRRYTAGAISNILNGKANARVTLREGRQARTPGGEVQSSKTPRKLKAQVTDSVALAQLILQADFLSTQKKADACRVILG